MSWHASQDPAARCVTVDSSHGGMVAHRQVWAAVAAALTDLAPAPGTPAS
ncbi:hypothetical protein [Micromonospora auratinigra]|nr:hypothetical protein [Micromonospora auratinigra]